MRVAKPDPPFPVKKLKVCSVYITSSSSYSSTSQWYAKVISFLFQNSKKNTAMEQKNLKVSKISALKMALIIKIVCKQRFHYNIQNNNLVENTKESVIKQKETTVYNLGESWDEQQLFSWKMIFCRKINWTLETQLSNSACPGQVLDYSFSFLVGRHLARAPLPIRQVKIKVTWLAGKFTWPGWPEDTSF